MDEGDVTTANLEQLEKASALRIRANAAAIPKGSPGDCVECGDYNERLVNGICSPCRDDLIKLGIL